MKRRESHHYWSAEKDENKILIKRRIKNKIASYLKRRKASSMEANKRKESEYAVMYWNLFGSSLVDDNTLSSTLPRSIVENFNKSASIMNEPAPRIFTWSELSNAFGKENIDEVRKHVSSGMKIRMASKYFNVPFIVAAEILDKLGSVRFDDIKNAVRIARNERLVNRSDDKVVKRISYIIKKYAGNRSKIAVDPKAKEYWENYYGPFGKEMVREIKKRVRADIAESWMRKNGVDQKAIDYWSNYYGEYGMNWVSIVPKKISPSKK